VSAILSLAKKDLRLLARDRMDLFFTLAFPVFVAVFFGSIFGGGGDGNIKGMPVAIVDLDRSEGSRGFQAELAKDGEFDIAHVDDRAAAEEMVRAGDRTAAIVIPKRFGDSTEAMFSGERMVLDVTVDPSHKAEAGMLQGILTKHAFARMFGSFSDPSKMQAQARKSLERVRNDAGVDPKVRSALEPFLASLDTFSRAMPAAVEATGEKDAPAAVTAKGGWEPIAVEVHNVAPRADPGGAPRGLDNSYAVSFPQAVIWGVLGAAMSFGVSLSNERAGGTLMRLLVSPLRRGDVLLGKALACFVTIVVVSVLILALGYFAFHVQPVSLPMLGLAIVCVAFAFVGVMMILATISKSAGGAAGLGRGVMLVMAMIGGGSIPLFLMPAWMKAASGISPFKWAVEALDGAVWRGLTLGQMALPLLVLVGIGIAGFAIGSRVFARTAA
jgi:ABC-2 type transport system permease protein